MIQSETQIGWQDYLAIILRRRWFFAVPCIAIIVVSLIVGLFLQKIYRADTILMVQDQQVINPLIAGLAVSTPVGERMRVLREELLSWSSLSRLAHEMEMDRPAKHPYQFEQLIKRLQKNIIVGMRGRDLVMISYEDPNPELAQRLVNTITSIYLDRNVESQSAEAGTAISFLESELAVYQKTLEGVERALREFKELYVMQMPVATQLNEQVVRMEVSLAQLLVENTEQHPTVFQLRRQIEDLKNTRNQEIRRVIATALAKGADPKIYEDLAQALGEPLGDAESSDPSIRAGRDAYQAWVKRMDSPVEPTPTTSPVGVVASPDGKTATTLQVMGSGSASVSLAPREEQELARLTRDYDVHSRTYQHMQERLQLAKVTQRLGESDEGTKFKILEPARLPLKPVRPDMVKIFFLSLLLGMFVGVGVAFVAEYLDQSFQTAEDLQAALELPVIGSISTIVTEADLEAARRHRNGWMTFKNQLQLVKTYLIQPVWGWFDRAMVRWGL